MPIHWGLSGPDRFAPRILGAFLVPLISLALYACLRLGGPRLRNNTPITRVAAPLILLAVQAWAIWRALS